MNSVFSKKFSYLQQKNSPYIEDHSPAVVLAREFSFAIASCHEDPMTSPLEQKKIKINGPVVVTANRVADGAVVYRHADGGWTTDIDGAVVATDADGARTLMAAAVDDDLRAVGPYIAPVKLSAGGHVRPGNLRELIRLGGPTIDLPVPLGC
jgi:hypothetical protein